MSAPTLLLYFIQESKAAKIQALCAPLGIRTRIVSESDMELTVSEVLSGAHGECAEPVSDPREMLLMSDFPKPIFDLFLNTLRTKKLNVALKAVATPVNREWNSKALMAALIEEHDRLSHPKA